MNRRKSIKALFVGTVSTGILVEACEAPDKKSEITAAPKVGTNVADRMQEEIVFNKELSEGKFFTAHELATVAVLSDIIVPRDEISGSATDAKVPEFIDFMMLDRPENQTPIRGGLRWLDLECLKQYEKTFVDCSVEQQIKTVDAIAYPKKVKPGYEQGAHFFTLMRNFVLSGFYTSKMGLEDVGYMGNKPNQWNGVPDEVLKQYNIEYSERELKESISYEKV